MTKLFSLFLLVLILIFDAKADEIKCPEGSILVDFVVSFSKERIQTCQKKVGDKYQKHGPEIIYNADGSIKNKSYYLDDVKSSEPTTLKINSDNQSSEIKKELEQVINILLEHVLVGSSYTRRIDIIDGSGGCHDSALERLQFVLKGMPYTNSIKFKRRCFFAGDFRYELDKKLSALFKVDNVFGYDQVSFDYLISKNAKDGVINISTEVFKGEFSSSSKKKFKFKAFVSLKINLREAIASQGKSGITIESGSVDIFEYGGEPFSFHKDVY